MAALTVKYLYEDLPEEYVVSASVWNDVMGIIKNTLNNHAQQIEIRVGDPAYITVGEETVDHHWQGTIAPYSCTITQGVHGKSKIPQVRVFDSSNNEIFGSHAIDPNTGSVTVYSNSKNVTFELVIR